MHTYKSIRINMIKSDAFDCAKFSQTNMAHCGMECVGDGGGGVIVVVFYSFSCCYWALLFGVWNQI